MFNTKKYSVRSKNMLSNTASLSEKTEEKSINQVPGVRSNSAFNPT